MSVAMPLPESESSPAVAELRAVVARARRGDHDAMPRLRELLDAHPEIFHKFGDIAQHAQAAWVRLAAGSDLALAEALRRRLADLGDELLGPTPTALERLLVERVVACYVQVHYADSLAAQSQGAPIRQAEFALKRQALAQRALDAAVKSLATTRGLLSRVAPRAAKVSPPVSRVAIDKSGERDTAVTPVSSPSSPLVVVDEADHEPATVLPYQRPRCSDRPAGPRKS